MSTLRLLLFLTIALFGLTTFQNLSNFFVPKTSSSSVTSANNAGQTDFETIDNTKIEKSDKNLWSFHTSNFINLPDKIDSKTFDENFSTDSRLTWQTIIKIPAPHGPYPVYASSKISPLLKIVESTYCSGDKMHQAYPMFGNVKLVIADVGALDETPFNELLKTSSQIKAAYMFEPNPSIGPRLEAAAAKVWNSFPNMRVAFFNVALSNFSGETDYFVHNCLDRKNGGQSTRPCSADLNSIGISPWGGTSTKIKVFKLDDLINEHVHILKIDTQGHELQVLKGATRMLKSDPPNLLLLEYSPAMMRETGGGDPANMLPFLYSFGYICYYCPSKKSHIQFHDDRSIFKFHFNFEKEEHKLNWKKMGWTDILCSHHSA